MAGPQDEEHAAHDAVGRLVGDLDGFAREHWDRAPLLRRGAWTQHPPLTVDDVDRLLTVGGLRWPAFRLVDRGRTVPRREVTRRGRVGGQPVDDLADAPRVLDAVDRGATLVLQGLHRSHPPVAAACRALRAALGHPVQANAYLTPPSARGLEVHHDTHDVIALQTHGVKHWVLHEPAVVSALPSQPWSSERHEPGEVLLDTELAAGDALYLPRGIAHAAETAADGHSLHLTFGIHPVTWRDLVRRALDDLDEDVELRRSLPVGGPEAADPAALAERLQRAAKRLADADPQRLLDAQADRDRDAVRPQQRGRLVDLVGLDAIGDDALVQRPVDVSCRIETPGDGRARVVLADRELRLPDAARPGLEAALDGQAHRVADLPGLDAEGRRVLARRLVREGALRVVRGARG